MSLENFPNFLLNFSESGMNGKGKKFYRFKSFRLNVEERQLLQNNSPVPLTPKAFDVLAALVERNGHLVEKEELLRIVWAGSFVEEANISRIVHTLRKVLGEDENGNKFIETVAKKGYRFVAKVQIPENHNLSLESAKLKNSDNLTAEVFNPPINTFKDQPESNLPPKGASHRIFFFALLGIGSLALFFSWSFYKFGKFQNAFQSFRQIKFTRLTNHGNVKTLSLSPDGNFIAFVSDEKDGESLSVRQLEMSNILNLVPPQKGNFSFITFSTDGKSIYYGFYSGEKVDGEIFSVPTLGGMSRKIPNLIAYSMSFAPDGKRFAHVVSNMADGEKHLVISNLEDNRLTKLIIRKAPRSFNVKEQVCSWSPDGKTIAVISNEVDREKHFSTIVGVNSTDGTERLLTSKRWNYIHSLQWLKDGSGLFVIGNDTSQSNRQIWFVPAEKGEAISLTNDLFDYSFISVMPDGRQIVSVQETQISSIQLGTFGQNINEFVELISETGQLDSIFTSPDEKIVFRSNADGKSNLWMLEMNGQQKKQITTDAQVDSRGLCMTAKGEEIVFPSRKAETINLWRVSLKNGETHQLTDGEGEFYPLCTPDNLSVIYQKGFGYGVKSTLWKKPLNGGAAIQLTDYFAMRPALSTDGGRIAFFYLTDEKWRIGIISSKGGEIEQSIDVPEGVHDRLMRWSPDGKSLFYASNEGEIGNIWLLPLNGKQPTKITDFNSQIINDFSFSADGKRLITSRTNITNDIVTLAW